MEKEKIENIISKQKKFFEDGNTLSIEFRIKSLKTLYSTIVKYKDRLEEALQNDLGKSFFESDMAEIHLTLSEISYQIKHIKKWTKDTRVHTPLTNFKSSSFIHSSPYGNVLIISPWNYPVLLTLEPLCNAIAAGNTVILKPSAYSDETSRVLEEMIRNTFTDEYIAVITGGREENSILLEEKFDYIFFTGSKEVGRLVMEKASRHLTPVSLELGGKSPCIITKNAKIPLSAKRFVFGKLLNVGQTCVAPDYVLVDESVKDNFVKAVIKEIKTQYGENILDNKDYGKIINEKHFNRIISLINKDKVIYGGKYKRDTLQIEPTIMDNVNKNDDVMKEEIFGPLIPVITYKTTDDAISFIKEYDHPLALYIFTEDKKEAETFINKIGFGGGCINDCIIHLATSEMGFGGFGESGMGSYHGKSGFDTFTHYKSIVNKKTTLDLNMRYSPYNEKKHNIIKKFLK